MDQNIFLARSNTVATTLTETTFYPVFTAKDVIDLSASFKSQPMLAKIVAHKSSHSYVRCYIFFSIALAAYIVIAIGNDVEVDMDLAMTSLVILFSITLAKVDFLRRLLGKP
ncbi:hypothetical protein [Collimonas silvisoli]|uniref:hypothetical protein n=1 Tax=Collimonas silvisoli TaxID=2825884 RepID=UPI001B8CDDF0|nr:hypothetical protein [Collimonas silvisoli]